MERELGIKVYMEQKKENIEGKDLIIYTAAILKDNEELIAAKKSNVRAIERNDFLAYFTEQYSNTICVCGTHGKTTTTSMISACFVDANLDPTIEVGAILDSIGGNYRIGNSEYFILESGILCSPLSSSTSSKYN